MRSNSSWRRIVLGGLGLLCAASVFAPSARSRDYSEEREPCTHYVETRQPHFGDTHVHTAYSFDANGQDTRNTPWDAYRFAMGERVGLQPYDADGEPTRTAQLRRPLDFTVITDHAERQPLYQHYADTTIAGDQQSAEATARILAARYLAERRE